MYDVFSVIFHPATLLLAKAHSNNLCHGTNGKLYMTLAFTWIMCRVEERLAPSEAVRVLYNVTQACNDIEAQIHAVSRNSYNNIIIVLKLQ